MSIVFPVLILFYSIGIFALNQENPQQDLSKLTLHTGSGNPQLVLKGGALEDFNRIQHQNAFAQTLAKIGQQSKNFDQKKIKESRLRITQKLLPDELNRPQIVALADTLGFSQNEDAETRGRKFMRLSLLIRDMYDNDNLVSRNLGIAFIKPKLSQQEILYYTIEALDHAISNFKSLESQLSEDRAIDFHLSLAQLSLWRLSQGRDSWIHRLADFELDNGMMILNAKSNEIQAAVFEHTAKAEKLLRNPMTTLPVVYNQVLRRLASELTADEKYDLILMHKQELDRAEEAEGEDVFEQLQKARGLENVDKNPLTYFSSDKIEVIKKAGRSIGKEDDALTKFVYNTMKIYALNKVTSVEKYFTQDVLQRYFIASGKIHRDTLLAVFLEKCEKIRDAASRIDVDQIAIFQQ